MSRPTARRDATLEANENRIAHAGEQNAEIAAAVNLLAAGQRDVVRGESEISRAERILCKIHGENLALCRRLRCENAALVAGVA